MNFFLPIRAYRLDSLLFFVFNAPFPNQQIDGGNGTRKRWTGSSDRRLDLKLERPVIGPHLQPDNRFSVVKAIRRSGKRNPFETSGCSPPIGVLIWVTRYGVRVMAYPRNMPVKQVERIHR